MARYIGPVCKLCRRENEKMFLKGERCYTPKCSFEKRAYAPGEHGHGAQRRADRISDYSRQLRAKQKARRLYGVMERQFRRYFAAALKRRGLTGMNLLQELELRVDNVVYRMGFAENRNQARQLVNHGHILVNGRRADIASMILKPGDKVEVREGSKKRTYFKELPDFAEKRTCAPWLACDVKTLSATVLRLPERGEIDGNLSEQLIVEYYSR